MKRLSIFTGIISTILFFSCGTHDEKSSLKNDSEQTHTDPFANLLADAQVNFQILPSTAQSESNIITPEKVLLGKSLFYDNRLSKNNTQSCNTCHNLSNYGVDNESTSEGDLKKKGNRNSPTVYNAAFHISQFWDGRAADVEEQAGMPVTNPVEMNMPSEKYVVDRIKKIEGYKTLFSNAFPDDKSPISFLNLKKAIASFERTLVTPGSFHSFIAGDINALNIDEKKGLKEFIETGCTTCHNGKTLGGGMLMKFPIVGNEYKSLTGSKNEDLGKMEQTKNEADKFVFKVPSLINITETGPYFHDGSVNDLGQVIKIMAKLQLNKDLNDDQIKNIKLFLGSLKGKIPEGANIAPEMPK